MGGHRLSHIHIITRASNTLKQKNEFQLAVIVLRIESTAMCVSFPKSDVIVSETLNEFEDV